MATSTNTPDLSPAAQAAIRRAMSALEGFDDEPQVKALLGKLGAIADPVGGGQAAIDRLAKALGDTEQIAKSDLSDGIRERAATAHRDLQREYLSAVSPAGAALWDARKAGRAA